MTAALISIPLLSAFLGWLIIKMSIYLLFHPVKAIQAGPFVLQGAYYKNERAIKAGLLSVIKQELSATNNITDQLTSAENLEKLKPEIEEHIDAFLKVRLKEAIPMIGMLIGDRTTSQLKMLFMQEMESLFPSVMRSYASHIKDYAELDRLIEARLSAITPEKIKRYIAANASGELLKLQWIAALAGLFIGCIQLLIIIFFLP